MLPSSLRHAVKRDRIIRQVILAVWLAGLRLTTLSAQEGEVSPSIAATPYPRVVWEATQRTRYATLDNQFRPGLSGGDQALSLRSTLRLGLSWPRLAVTVEGQDARAYLTDDQSNVSTTLVNASDLLQAFVEVKPAPAGNRLIPGMQIGRFSMELGSGRLVAQEVYRDVTRAFTGARLRWREILGGQLTAFAVLPVQTLPDSRVDLLANRAKTDREYFNQRFWGAFIEQMPAPHGGQVDAYAYGPNEADVAGQRETRDRALWTLGGRLLFPPRAATLDLEVEAIRQGGRASATSGPNDGPQPASAGYLHAAAGYTFRAAGAPRLSLEHDLGTGDDEPGDQRWTRFDTLFGNRRVDLGATSIYGALGRENIRTTGVRFSLAPHARADLFAVVRTVALDSATDSFASTGVRDASGRSGRDGALQIDTRVRVWLAPRRLRLESGVTHLMPGRFLREAPNATRGGATTFAYADVTLSLGR